MLSTFVAASPLAAAPAAAAAGGVGAGGDGAALAEEEMVEGVMNDLEVWMGLWLMIDG